MFRFDYNTTDCDCIEIFIIIYYQLNNLMSLILVFLYYFLLVIIKTDFKRFMEND